MTVLCAHPGCGRPNPTRNNIIGPGSRYCSLHDGDNDPLVCICPTAIVTNLRVSQCDTCGRPVVALHPSLGPYRDTYPQLATQTITRPETEQVA